MPSISESSSPDPVVILRHFPCEPKCSNADFISSLGYELDMKFSDFRRVLFAIVCYMKIVNYWERTIARHAQKLLILLPSLLFHKVFPLSLAEEQFGYYWILLYYPQIPALLRRYEDRSMHEKLPYPF